MRGIESESGARSRPAGLPLAHEDFIMKLALHAILGIGLSLAAFSGVLLYRQVFDLADAIFPSRAGAAPFPDYLLTGYSFFVGLFVAATAIAGLIAGRRWIAPEPRRYSQRFQPGQMVALTVGARHR
jgi:hypothetical protein